MARSRLQNLTSKRSRNSDFAPCFSREYPQAGACLFWDTRKSVTSYRCAPLHTTSPRSATQRNGSCFGRDILKEIKIMGLFQDVQKTSRRNTSLRNTIPHDTPHHITAQRNGPCFGRDILKEIKIMGLFQDVQKTSLRVTPRHNTAPRFTSLHDTAQRPLRKQGHPQADYVCFRMSKRHHTAHHPATQHSAARRVASPHNATQRPLRKQGHPQADRCLF
jgi:hypothetical protein